MLAPNSAKSRGRKINHRLKTTRLQITLIIIGHKVNFLTFSKNERKQMLKGKRKQGIIIERGSLSALSALIKDNIHLIGFRIINRNAKILQNEKYSSVFTKIGYF